MKTLFRNVLVPFMAAVWSLSAVACVSAGNDDGTVGMVRLAATEVWHYENTEKACNTAKTDATCHDECKTYCNDREPKTAKLAHGADTKCSKENGEGGATWKFRCSCECPPSATVDVVDPATIDPAAPIIDPAAPAPL